MPDERPSARAALTLLAILVAVGIALAAAGYGILYLMRDQGGVWSESWRVLVSLPPSFSKRATIVSIVAVLVAGLLAILALAETRAIRAYARLEAEARAAAPDAVVTPYAGEEGEGVAFDEPDGRRTLLLKPVAGVGQPRVVVFEPPPEAPWGPPDGAAS